MQAVQQQMGAQGKRERETIHSGHFMVSHFEAEEQDDEDEVAVPIPEVAETNTTIIPVKQFNNQINTIRIKSNQQQLSIDTSLAKLFQCMTLAYRQKLTSPKWNRFRGIRLRWKDKIRLNNVIWRCWHLQFIKKENTLICQFASPLDVDTHNKPEAVVLEGKYWKRKLAAVTAEYKKWRLFYRNHALGQGIKDDIEMLNDVDLLSWNTQSQEDMHMMVDEDYMGLMSDTLFSTITNQPFVFPDSREIAKAGLADFIQPSLGPLQPNLDDYMDTFEPLQEFMMSTCKMPLPTVPEEQSHNTSWSYPDLDLMTGNGNLQLNTMPSAASVVDQFQQELSVTQLPLNTKRSVENRQTSDQHLYQQHNTIMQPSSVSQYVSQQQIQQQPPSYHSSVISKNAKSHKNMSSSTQVKLNHQQHQQQQQQQAQMQQTEMYSKSTNNVYTSYPEQTATGGNICVSERLQMPSIVQDQQQIQLVAQAQQDLQQFKMPLPSPDHQRQQQSSGYKFSTLTVPNMKFTSQQVSQSQQMMHPIHSAHSQYNSVHTLSDKSETRMRGAPKGARQRSRSNTREQPQRRPPLLTAISDPSLLTHTNSTLLTQLLTGSPDGEMFSRTTSLLPQPPPPPMPDRLPKQIRIKEETCPIPIMPQPPPVPATLIITTPVNISTIQQSTSNDQQQQQQHLMLNSFSNSNSPLDSSHNINSPTSSQDSIGSPNMDTPGHRDQRRVGHIHAEQKRRCNIKNGFDMIHSLIPHLNQNPNAKLSKAAMLQKGAEYIRQLRSERSQLNEEMECLRQQIETLNTSISNCQSMLPATGAPVSRRRDSKMQEMFNDYVKKRTMENWKYWIFSLLFKPLLESFNNFVSTSCLDDLYRSTLLWIEQHCTLGDLRPAVLNSLKYLCTTTEILTEPDKLPDEVRSRVLSNNKTSK